jgi:hypothetical protein
MSLPIAKGSDEEALSRLAQGFKPPKRQIAI